MFFQADLWSVGVILFQLVTGKLPFYGANLFKLRQNIHESNGVKFPKEIKDDLHPDFIDLCRGLLRLDPSKFVFLFIFVCAKQCVLTTPSVP
jgi:serine/threonine-protein kinase ULK/ATG1